MNPSSLRRLLARAYRLVRPIPRNPYFVARPRTYDADGFATVHDAGFLNGGDRRFSTAYQTAVTEGVPTEIALQTDIRWRAHLYCWAVKRALSLPAGDLVECGVWYGFLARTAVDYVRFAEHTGRRFYLVDPFGNPLPTMTRYADDIHEVVRRRFARWPNVELVRGLVPEALSRVPSERVAFLSIDMNGVEPERAALEHFYPRLVPGGVIYLDDYGWTDFPELRTMVDGFFADKPEPILRLPTGQALVVKA